MVGLDSCSQSFLTHLPMVRSWDIITTKIFELGTHSARNAGRRFVYKKPSGESSGRVPAEFRQSSGKSSGNSPAEFRQLSGESSPTTLRQTHGPLRSRAYI